MKIEKMAQQDAEKWAAAEMFYGEGAGTRRKLVGAELEARFAKIPGYAEAYDAAYAKLDMNKFAQAAIKERKAIDRAAKAGQNFRAIKNGNLNNLSTGVFLVVGLGWAAHVTGYDKKALIAAKKKYAEIEKRVHDRRIQKAQKGVYGVTNIHEENA